LGGVQNGGKNNNFRKEEKKKKKGVKFANIRRENT